MVRASSYVIYVDLPDNDREMLLVHGYSGAYDKVSREVARFIRSKEAKKAPKPLYGVWTDQKADEAEATEPSRPTLDLLLKRGYLTEKSFDQEEDDFKDYVTRAHERKLRTVPNYMFITTYDCNLRCAYCFQDHMRTDPGFRHLLRGITPETIDRCFRAIPQIEALHGVDPADGPFHREMGFFGGEPFLARNRPIVDHVIRRTLEIGTAKFWAVTNGTELEAYQDLLTPERISNLQITLDGPPEAHDRRRIYADGSGSFEKIAPNILMALEQGVRIDLRMNVDRTNIDELPLLADEIVARGWHEYPNFVTYVSPIVAQSKEERKRTFNTWQLDRAVTAMRREHENLHVIGRTDDGIRRRAFQVFEDPGAMGKSVRESFCSAHTGLYLFDAFGDIYTCWEHTGDAKIRLGHVHEDGTPEMNMDLTRMWQSRTVASNPVCSKCRYSLHCGGGCAAIAMAQTGKFFTNYCDGFGQRFRASVADAYLDHCARQAKRLARSKAASELESGRLAPPDLPATMAAESGSTGREAIDAP